VSAPVEPLILPGIGGETSFAATFLDTFRYEAETLVSAKKYTNTKQALLWGGVCKLKN
jgi:hypothetical protein